MKYPRRQNGGFENGDNLKYNHQFGKQAEIGGKQGM